MDEEIDLTAEQDELLTLLAKRKSKLFFNYNYESSFHKRNNWCAWKKYKENIAICFVCDKEFQFSPNEWHRHGLNHLKESGLLIFV